jgi:stringent starvation protein B
VTPLKYYLLRAAWDWAVDNDFTPHVIVDVTVPGVQVPAKFVENGRIVLNVHPQAIHGFVLDATGIRFSARFSGQAQTVELPIDSVQALYARESGQGVSFPEKEAAVASGDKPDEPPPDQPGPRKGPTLKIVK